MHACMVSVMCVVSVDSLQATTNHQKEPSLDDEASEDWDVTNLVSMLENQVSKLDKQLE